MKNWGWGWGNLQLVLLTLISVHGITIHLVTQDQNLISSSTILALAPTSHWAMWNPLCNVIPILSPFGPFPWPCVVEALVSCLLVLFHWPCLDAVVRIIFWSIALKCQCSLLKPQWLPTACEDNPNSLADQARPFLMWLCKRSASSHDPHVLTKLNYSMP